MEIEQREQSLHERAERNRFPWPKVVHKQDDIVSLFFPPYRTYRPDLEKRRGSSVMVSGEIVLLLVSILASALLSAARAPDSLGLSSGISS